MKKLQTVCRLFVILEWDGALAFLRAGNNRG